MGAAYGTGLYGAGPFGGVDPIPPGPATASDSVTLPWECLLTPLLGDEIFPTSVAPQRPPDNANTFATDVALLWNPFLGGADFTVENTDLASHRDLVTSITLSLFTNRRALDDDELPYPFDLNRGGWWGDAFLLDDANTESVLGSRLWLLSRSKSSPALPNIAKGYVVEALNWLLEKNIAASLDIEAFFIANDPSKLGITITVERPGGDLVNLNYQYVWDQVVAGGVA